MRNFFDDTGRPTPKGVLGVLANGKGSITSFALPNTCNDWAVEAVGVHSRSHRGLVQWFILGRPKNGLA